jgi:hypothetical protein
MSHVFKGVLALDQPPYGFLEFGFAFLIRALASLCKFEVAAGAWLVRCRCSSSSSEHQLESNKIAGLQVIGSKRVAS